MQVTELTSFLDFLPDFDNRSVLTNWDLFVSKVNELTNKHILTHKIVNPQGPWYGVHIRRLANRNAFFAWLKAHPLNRGGLLIN